MRPDNAWPEYPRPQMVRRQWQNLNGLWKYAIRKKEDSQPQSFDGDILVPYPVESALSGVMRRLGYTQRLWYRRQFDVAQPWLADRVLLHFGAVDWDTTVIVNGVQVGTHRGGYDPFSFDITDALTDDGKSNDIVVSVWDPSEIGDQPRGKQVLRTEGVWYTCSGGIWQTVWLEPVPEVRIDSLSIVPDVDRGVVTVTVDAGGGHVEVTARDGDRNVGSAAGNPNEPLEIKLQDVTLWSPDNPHLYDLSVAITDGDAEVDHVESYFGMRKVSLGKDEAGRTRILLNDQPINSVCLIRDSGRTGCTPRRTMKRCDTISKRPCGWVSIRFASMSKSNQIAGTPGATGWV